MALEKIGQALRAPLGALSDERLQKLGGNLRLAVIGMQAKRISTLYARLLKLQKEMDDKVDLKAAFPKL